MGAGGCLVHVAVETQSNDGAAVSGVVIVDMTVSVYAHGVPDRPAGFGDVAGFSRHGVFRPAPGGQDQQHD